MRPAGKYKVQLTCRFLVEEKDGKKGEEGHLSFYTERTMPEPFNEVDLLQKIMKDHISLKEEGEGKKLHLHPLFFLCDSLSPD